MADATAVPARPDSLLTNRHDDLHLVPSVYELLGRVEAAQAQKLGRPSFKFSKDEEMLEAIAPERSAPVSAAD